MINDFIFKYADRKLRIIIIILPTDRPDIILPTACTTNT